MSKFSSGLAPQLPNSSEVKLFASGAKTQRGEVPREVKRQKPTNGINLRLNDYELELARDVAKLQDRSIQKTLMRILIPALEQLKAELE